MTNQIVSRATIRARARAAFDGGKSRDSHGMNPGALALVDWLAEYDRCASQVSNFTPAAKMRVDVAQVAS